MPAFLLSPEKPALSVDFVPVMGEFVQKKIKWLDRILSPVTLLLTMFLVFEEWLWDQLTWITQLLGRLRFLQIIEAQIRKLPPYPSLFVLFLPSLIVIPIKLGALYLISRGQGVWGVILILGAKVAGTALVARFFALTRDQVLRIEWFRKLHDQVNRLLGWAKAWLRATPVYQSVVGMKVRFLAWWRS